MERVIGIRFRVPPEPDAVAACSELSWRFFRRLIGNRRAVFNQILFPYADALSVSGNPGTESTRVFGTHILLRNIPPEAAAGSLESSREDFTETAPESLPPYEIIEFPLTDGCVMSADIAEFLSPAEEFPSPAAPDGMTQAGDFSLMLGGFLPHWRIRECARIFASFTEMAYRATHGEISGVYGGSLLLPSASPCLPAVREIFSIKTGCKA